MRLVKSLMMVATAGLLVASCGKNPNGARGNLGTPKENKANSEVKVLAVIALAESARKDLADQNAGKFDSGQFCLRLVEKADKKSVQYLAKPCGESKASEAPKMTFTLNSIKPAIRRSADPKVSLRDYDLMLAGTEMGRVSIQTKVAVNTEKRTVETESTKFILEELCPKGGLKYNCAPIFDANGVLIGLN